MTDSWGIVKSDLQSKMEETGKKTDILFSKSNREEGDGLKKYLTVY